MKMRSLMAALTMAAGTLGFATVTNAARVVDVEIGVAPPPPAEQTIVVTPPVREGFIYEPGHYGWDSQRYVWVEVSTFPIAKGINGGTTRWSSAETSGITAWGTGTTKTDA